MSWLAVRMQPGHYERFLTEMDAAEGISTERALAPGIAEVLAQHNSWALIDPEGAVRGVGGTIEQWPGRHTAWVFLDTKLGRHLIRAARLCKAALAAPAGRIEATVREDFEAGHRMARFFGMEVENPPGRLLAYGPDGETHIQYVRFQ